jgi:2-keto-4-pentenoate hydratase/2-oxohepta-3-ene-1,7-dioic acid hydratase in catechol pathway
MKLACVLYDGAPATGVVEDDHLALIPFSTPVDALRAGPEAIAQALRTARRVALDPTTLLPPVPRPGKILGLGLNYMDHVREGGREVPTSQMWFNKQAGAAHTPFGTVLAPRGSEQMDYEGELVAIIGWHAWGLTAADAVDAIAGYAVGCDYSVRDWQKAAQTMTMGKSYDTHAPFGPFLITPDEIADVQALPITTRVNGDVRQNGNTADMIFPVAEQVAFLSNRFTLAPGDVLFTGTPAGVAQWRDDKPWLKPGDVVEVDIATLGTIRHTVTADTRPPRLD